MSEHPATPMQRMAGPIYFLAFLFLFLPLVDFIANVWPLNTGAVTWRYGAIGLSSGFLLTPLLGLIMLLVTSMYLEQRGTRIFTGALAGAMAIVLLLGTMLFLLDSLQMRREVTGVGKASYDMGIAKAALKLVTGAISCAWIALVAFANLPARAQARRTTRPLVVGAADGGSKVPGA